MPAQKSVKAVQSPSKSDKKAKPVPASKPPVAKSKAQLLKESADALLATSATAKKKPGRPPKAAAAATESSAPPKTGAKRGRKPKVAAEGTSDEMDMSDIEADLVGEPEAAAAPGEKVKPLRMKISKAKERALMKEFGLDETVLSEEDMAKRRQRLKTLITLGKTPLVVLDDANLDIAVNCALDGAFYQTGQRCTASSRLVVGSKIHDAFVERMVEGMKKLKVDHALKDGTVIGPVVDEAQMAQDEKYIQIARDEGGELAWGGERLNRDTKGNYLSPALFRP